MHKMAEKIMKCVHANIESKGLEGITEHELIEMKYWACIADAMASFDYHFKIIEEMEKPENQYGVNYDENGRFYTPHRNSMGQFKRGYDEEMEHSRDMDRPMGHMYYPEVHAMDSRYDMAKKSYEEHKVLNPATDNTRAIEKLLNVIKEDIKDLKPMMTTSEKAMAKTEITGIANMLV